MRTCKRFVWSSLIFFSLAACAPAPESAQPEPVASEAVDVEAERTALLDADRAWSQTPPDVESFVDFFADDAHFLTPEGPTAVGQAEIREAVSSMFATEGFSLTWEPTEAVVSESGDLGYTVGTFELTMNDPDGNAVTREGKYLSTWRKQEDGQWKVTVDAPNFNAPAP